VTSNYYDYTDDQGVVWSVLLRTDTAAFVSAVLAASQRPLLSERRSTRKLRLADTTTGKEALVIAPYAWPYNLGDVVSYKGGTYQVTFQLDEQRVLDKP
jgi:hypothetical protein